MNFQDKKYQSLYEMFRQQGVLALCTVCGKKGLCSCSVVDLSTECFDCAVERIEREEAEKAERDRKAAETAEKLKRFNLEDFCRL